MRKIILYVIIFNFSLFCNSGCLDIPDIDGDYDANTWYIDIENKLSYSVRIENIFYNGKKSKIDSIQPNEIRVDWISNGPKNSVPNASTRIYQMSVFKENNNTLIMQLMGAEMNNYIIHTGKSIYGGANDLQFLFQIREEDVGVGVDKEINLNESAIDSHLHGNDEN